jgi:hypothetical protein
MVSFPARVEWTARERLGGARPTCASLSVELAICSQVVVMNVASCSSSCIKHAFWSSTCQTHRLAKPSTQIPPLDKPKLSLKAQTLANSPLPFLTSPMIFQKGLDVGTSLLQTRSGKQHTLPARTMLMLILICPVLGCQPHVSKLGTALPAPL